MKSNATKTMLSKTLLVPALCLGMMTAGAAMAQSQGQEMEEHGSDSSQPASDTWITTKVKADLLTTDNVSGTDVSVETVNGVVTLTGTVATQAEFDRTVKVAKGIEGVTQVNTDGLKVVPSSD
ncbi:BON domain-containing protein [Pseudoxanthomonas dokdonensis]|uniref:Osmotically-inducible protein Y n=1 Tax=Pseudoxanthomonas dokdonensis TaxID=344882 RepID=A0A0R0CKV4_9GAMM|nr:BON domain-containing protein [Pseudoxanthomonas dokdonensis]KRG69990.1 hypothetical protein ABB29_07030 [Pseudoxanthomonas dokdonensis]